MRKVHFSMSEANTPAYIGYSDERITDVGNWPKAFLPFESVAQFVEDNQELHNRFELGIDRLSIDAQNNLLITPDDEEEQSFIIRPETITDEQGQQIEVYGIGRYCWHVDEFPDNETELAAEFSHVLRTWLTIDEITQINVLNENDPDKTICHSHQFCDAGEASLIAYEKVLGHKLGNGKGIEEDIEQLNFLNRAWDIAKNNKFYMETN